MRGDGTEEATVGWLLLAEGLRHMRVTAEATKYIGIGLGAIKNG
jgi:hypothetical protein